MSPDAETSTNNGDSTSSRLYWSRTLMAFDQVSSIFWNSFTCGPTSVVTVGGVDPAVPCANFEPASGAGLWAKTAQHESRKTEKQTALRLIMELRLPAFNFSSCPDPLDGRGASGGSRKVRTRVPNPDSTIENKVTKPVLHQGLQAFGLEHGDDGVLDGNPGLFAELTQRTRHGFPGCTRHGSHLLMGQQQREPESATISVFPDLVGQFEKQAAEAR